MSKETGNYRGKYEKKRERRNVSFNMEDKEEAQLFAYSQTVVFSSWVKELMRQELIEKGVIEVGEDNASS